jgi:steroid delta-isomerase-like uncharacterized protein
MNPIDILRQAHEAFSRHDLDTAIAPMRPDVILNAHAAGQTFTSRAAVREFLSMYYAMSSDVHLINGQYFAAGNKVVAQLTAVGVNDGPFLDFPASGRPFALDLLEIWTFDDEGYAVEGHSYSDTLGLLMQLGHVAAPA